MLICFSWWGGHVVLIAFLWILINNPILPLLRKTQHILYVSTMAGHWAKEEDGRHVLSHYDLQGSPTATV